MDPEMILRFVGQLGLTATAAAIFAWGAFKWFGKKWLESQFAHRLERFRHEQNQEIERLRYRINALMDRTTKLHQNEFQVLPELWDKLSIASSDVQTFVSRLQSYTDVDHMQLEQYCEFVNQSDFAEWQKAELLQLDRGKRNDTYQRFSVWQKSHKANTSYAEFHNYLASKGIFVPAELKEKFKVARELMADAMRERVLQEQAPSMGEGRFEKGDKFQREMPTLLSEIEAEVQARLWEANKLD
jgi:hypothetical protein